MHRDIKPSNILLDGDKNQHVYLADFNLAKAIDKGSDLTQTGCLIGTPAYMAPELIEKPESVSSDIYALGVLLYHMLTGRVPFSGSSPLAVYWKHMHELPVSPSHLNPAISAPVEQVIMQALNKDPRRRFPSAEALAQAYINALQASNTYVGAHLTVRTSEPTLTDRARKKIVHITLLTVALKNSLIPRWHNPRHNIQRAVVGLALAALLIIPLSLGFLLGRAIAPLPQTYRAQVAQALQPPPLVSTPTPQTTPTVHPPGGNIGESTIPHHSILSFPLHEPKYPHHRHGNGNGNGNGNDNDNDNSNGNSNGNGNGNDAITKVV